MGKQKIKIFVSAYACEPGLGSEIGVGWHWVLEMSKYFELWVLTRQSNRKRIEDWFTQHNMPCPIHFIYFDLPKKLRFWKKGLRGVRIYYVLWQKLTNRLVKKTMEENGIDIYHLLTYGNALWPASNYGQKKIFIWGPIGVGDTVSADYSKHYGMKGQFVEWLRRLSVKTLSLNRGYYIRCRDAKIIFCKTETAFNHIPLQFRNKALVFTDVAVEMTDISTYLKAAEKSDSIIKYLAVGRLDAWRGFDILIEAFAKAVKTNSDIRLEILGKGSDRERLGALIKKLNMHSFISFGGQVTMEDYYLKMTNCDVVVNPCLKEGAVTTAFDSMSFAKPLICIETGGYTRYFTNDYSVVIPLTKRQEVIENLVAGIVQLTNREERKQKGRKARLAGEKYNWEEKGKQIATVIDTRLFQQAKKEERI